MYCNSELDKTLPNRFKRLVRKIKKFVWYVKSRAMSLNRQLFSHTCMQNFKTPNLSISPVLGASCLWQRKLGIDLVWKISIKISNQMYATYFLIRTWSLHSLKQFFKCNTNNKLKEFCLFVCSFSFHSRIFHSFGQVIIADKGLQILTYARHLWPLSSEGF